jgi:hypothetical protein
VIVTRNNPTTPDALSALLSALGFAAMARDVLTETDHARLSRSAGIIVRNTPEPQRHAVHVRLALLGLR